MSMFELDFVVKEVKLICNFSFLLFHFEGIIAGNPRGKPCFFNNFDNYRHFGYGTEVSRHTQ